MNKIEALNIVTNMTNGDTLNAAAGAPAKPQSSGTFRVFMNAHNNKANEASNSKKDNGGSTTFHILSKDRMEKMLNIKAKITGTGGENNEEDSRCGDSDLQTLIDGIVGILEGFGLLDYNMDESTMDEISEFIVSMVSEGENALNPDAQTEGNQETVSAVTEADYNKMLSEIIARMPNAEQFETLTQEAQTAIYKLIGEYQCSFDNTNNSGVDETEQNGGNPQSQEAETIGTDRIKMMLKISIDKSGGIKTKQLGSINTKASDKLESKNDTDGTDSKTLAFKSSSEALKTTRYQSEKNIEQATKNDMAENVARIAEKITSRQIEGKREFDVTLKPEFLGKLSIKLVMDGESIKAHIKAADQYVKGLISEQLPELSQALKEKGVNMADIEVTYENPMMGSTEHQFNGHSQNMSGSGKGMKAYAAGENDIESISFIDATDQTDLFLKNGSVEFSA